MKLIYPIIGTILVLGFGAFIHSQTYNPTNWNAFLMWSPLYASPLWLASALEKFSNRRQE